MFADPQTVTVNAVAKVMPRVQTDTKKSIYSLNDESFKLTISHQTLNNNRIRSVVRIDQRAVVTNPLDSTDNDYDTLSYYFVIDRPGYGFTMAQVEQLVAGLNAWTTTANVDKLFGQEP